MCETHDPLKRISDGYIEYLIAKRDVERGPAHFVLKYTGHAADAKMVQDYDSGFVAGSHSHAPDPKKLTQSLSTESPAYQRGYRDGWLDTHKA